MNHLLIVELTLEAIADIYGIIKKNVPLTPEDWLRLPSTVLRISSKPVHYFDVLSLSHAILLCYFLRKKLGTGPNAEFPLRVLHGIIVVWLLGVGGTSLTAWMLGLIPGFLKSDNGPIIYSSVAFLILYTPLYHLLDFSRFFWVPILSVFDGFSTTFAITNAGYDLAVKAVSTKNVYFTPILAGIISGCGGGLLNEAFGLTDSPFKGEFSVPETFTNVPSLSFILATFCSIFYSMTLEQKNLPPIMAKNIIGWGIATINCIANVSACLSSPKTLVKINPKPKILGKSKKID